MSSAEPLNRLERAEDRASRRHFGRRVVSAIAGALVSLALLASGTGGAEAATVTIDFEASPGPDGILRTSDDIATPFPCVVCKYLSQLGYEAVGVNFTSGTLFAGNLFPDAGPTNHYSSSAVPDASFSTPVYGIRLRSYSVWTVTLYAFDGAGSVIATDTATNSSQTFQLAELKVRSDRPIARFTVRPEGCSPAAQSCDRIVNVDDLIIDDVPPSTSRLTFNPVGVGHILLVPYFSAQSSNVTAINVINTNTARGKVVKVRFRGASNSDDVYDFQVFLSPGDVWTAGISQGADGRAQLATTDKSCTLPANVNGSFIIGRTATQAADRNAETREGYVEFLTMGDVVLGASGSNKRALYTATKHVSGIAPCTSSVLTALTHENAADYMEAPTTGLMSNWAIVNVARYLVYSSAAAAIEAQSIASGDPIAGNLVYWDQRSTPLTSGEVTTNTADPLLVGGYVAGARYDLPDLSTPYLGSCCTPAAQAMALSDSIAARTIAGEFNSQSSLGASTDWVVTFPTRRYHAAVRYTGTGAPARVFGADNPYFNSGNTEMKGYQMCSSLGLNALGFYDREERTPLVDDIVISPGTPVSLALCGEVAVLGINGGIDAAGIAASATFGALTRANASNGFVEGWDYFTTPTAYGLPMLARQFSRYSNTTTNVYYGTSYPTRILERGMMAP